MILCTIGLNKLVSTASKTFSLFRAFLWCIAASPSSREVASLLLVLGTAVLVVGASEGTAVEGIAEGNAEGTALEGTTVLTVGAIDEEAPADKEIGGGCPSPPISMSTDSRGRF